jgi:hypothetical protein
MCVICVIGVRVMDRAISRFPDMSANARRTFNTTSVRAHTRALARPRARAREIAHE